MIVYEAGDRLEAGTVNHYLTDGVVAVAELVSATSQSKA